MMNGMKNLFNCNCGVVAIDYHAVRVGQPLIGKILEQILFRAQPIKTQIHAGTQLCVPLAVLGLIVTHQCLFLTQMRDGQSIQQDLSILFW